MAVVIETTLGDITVDLYLDQRPVTCLNFLKLCKMKYYNFNLFHSIRSGFIAQTGDPTGEGSGGQSIFGLLEGPTKRFFSGEKMPKIRHTNAGLLSMVCTEDMMVGSQFFFTLAPDLDSLDGVHCVIGEVTEGHEVLRKLNEVICDDGHRPYQDVRITHTVILEDPFNDPSGFRAPSRSPSPSAERLKGGRIAPDEEIDETHGKTAEEVQEMIEEKEAKARATILEIVGDIPDADIAPPENVLFVCKLNPVTTDEDLEIIFSRFGEIVSCEVIRDKKTGDSLQYAFIEFSNKKSCEDAYFKMDNVLIDDRRIHVDFSQSVSKMRYLGKGRGVKYLDENDIEFKNNQSSNRSNSHKKNRDRDNKRNHDDDKHKKYDYENRINSREKKHQNIRDSDNHRGRSRSRSQSKRKRPTSRDRRYNKDNHNDENNSRHREHSEKSAIEKNRHSDNHKHNERNYSNSHKHKSQHSSEKIKHSENAESPKRRQQVSSKSDRHKPVSEKHKKKIEGSPNGDLRDSKIDRDKKKEVQEKTPKRMRENDSEPVVANKKVKRNDVRDKEEKKVESKSTSSTQKKPVEKKKKDKKIIKKKVVKKRRKYSTSSSDSDSSETSSSSDTSTSSEDRRRKRKSKKGRRRHSSTSSSSDSSSDSSSTSSSSYSSSSSSSSDSEPRKRKSLKKKPQKDIKKSKKRS